MVKKTVKRISIIKRVGIIWYYIKKDGSVTTRYSYKGRIHGDNYPSYAVFRKMTPTGIKIRRRR
jgi:hypothetical protein|tara:strand:- start:547 stop:738 length:192 start_codon:yes stop_codon:yes gene_type:complete